MFMPLNYEQKSPSEYTYTPSGKVYSAKCGHRCKLIFVRSGRFFGHPIRNHFICRVFLHPPFLFDMVRQLNLVIIAENADKILYKYFKKTS